LNKALKIRKIVYGPQSLEVASTLSNIGVLYEFEGDLNNAELNYKESLKIKENILGIETPSIGLSLNNLATLYGAQKRYSESITLYNRALDINLKALGKNSTEVALNLSNLAEVYLYVNELEKANKNVIEAIRIYEKQLGLDNPKVIPTLKTLSTLYLLKNNNIKAEETIFKILEISKNSYGDSHTSVAGALNDLGNLYAIQENYQKALLEYDKALETLNFTDFFDLYGYPLIPTTINILENRLYVLEKLSENNPQYEIEAIKTAEFILQFMERFRGNIRSQKSKIYQWEKYSDFFEAALSISVGLKHNQEIQISDKSYLFLESGLSRSFSEEISQKYLASEKDLSNDLLNSEKTFLENRKRMQLLLSKTYDYTKINEIKFEYIENEKAFSNFLDKLHIDYPYYAQLNYARPISLDLVKKHLLSPGKVAIAYYLGNKNSYVYVVSTTESELIPLNISKDEISKQIILLRKSLLWYEEKEGDCRVSSKSLKKIKDDSIQTEFISKTLYDQLIKPISPYLVNKNEVEIIPHSSLWLLPFEILIDNENDVLGKKYIINYQNSFTAWNLSHNFLNNKSQNKYQFVGYGDAIYENDERYKNSSSNKLAKNAYLKLNESDYKIPNVSLTASAVASRSEEVREKLKGCSFNRLSASKDEIVEIASLPTFKDSSETRTDYYASEWNLNDLEEYKYVHFSVHGSMRMIIEDKEIQPAIVLTQINPIESNVDGVLTMEEVMNNLKLNADLVVLSACDTGVGEVQGGEGVMSMTRAFQYAGAGSVLTSLWKVHEDATKLFMIQFYGYIDKGKKPAEALYLTKRDFQESKIEYNKPMIDLTHPFFWGAFVLVGGE